MPARHDREAVMKRVLTAAALLCLGMGPSGAADKLKIGFISTLSGPAAALGVDIRDGLNLAIKHQGGKLGGLPVELIVGDDTFSPDVGKQLTDRMLKRDDVDIMTGIVFSNILLAVAPAIFQDQTFYISPNAGPAEFAGDRCNPFFFNVAWQNDNLHEAMGKHVADKGYRNVYLIAPNYPAGRDALNGFKRFYKGATAGEVYTKLGQLDYAAELAQLRAAKPDAVFIFLPGGMGINFIKQFVASGLSKDVPLIVPGFGDDQDIIRPVGEATLGLFDTAHWAIDFNNAANKKFVAAFEKEYRRLPTVFAAQGWDTAMLIDAAVRDSKGKIEDVEAVRKAMRAAKFESVRGPFKFNRNQMPIQNYYLRVVAKDAQGRLVNKTIGTVFKDHGDAYVQDCKMK
jgi:branched-chain amino acid transport system substrate-binding protein